MKWGEELDFLLGIKEETGITPHALTCRPILHFYLDDYYRGFETLYKSKIDIYKRVSICDIAAYISMFPEMGDNELFVLVVQTADGVCLDFIKDAQDAGLKEQRPETHEGHNP